MAKLRSADRYPKRPTADLQRFVAIRGVGVLPEGSRPSSDPPPRPPVLVRATVGGHMLVWPLLLGLVVLSVVFAPRLTIWVYALAVVLVGIPRIGTLIAKARKGRSRTVEIEAPVVPPAGPGWGQPEARPIRSRRSSLAALMEVVGLDEGSAAVLASLYTSLVLAAVLVGYVVVLVHLPALAVGPERSVVDDDLVEALRGLGVAPGRATRGCRRGCVDDQQVAVPLAVGRDHVPRRVVGRGLGDRVLVGVGVVVPVLAARSRSPCSNFQCLAGLSSRSCRRSLCSSFEMWRKSFTDDGALVGEHLLEVADVLVATASTPSRARGRAPGPRARPRSGCG